MQVRGDRPAAQGTPQIDATHQGAASASPLAPSMDAGQACIQAHMQVRGDRPATFIDTALLDELSAQARALPRLRVNRNFHREGSDPCHRLLIALEPGSYIPPHCHLDPTKDETLLLVRGRIGALLLDAQGRITQARILDAATGCLGLTIPHGTFHSLVALEPGSVFFEAKAGPYAAPSEAERPIWAPLEQTPEAAGYSAWLRAQF